MKYTGTNTKGVFGAVPVCPVPVWVSYRTYRSLVQVFDVPKLPKCPVPVLLLNRTYRRYRNRRYRYPYRTELTEVSGTGI